MAGQSVRAKGIDVLNTSVTELMLLAIFFILLALAIAQTDLQGAEDNNVDLKKIIENQEAEIADLKGRLKDLLQSLGISSDLETELKKRLVLINELERENRDLRQQLLDNRVEINKLTSRVAALEAQLAGIKNALGGDDVSEAAFNSLTKAISDLRRIAAANNFDPDAPLDELIALIETELGERAVEVAGLRAKLKSAGLTDKEIAETDGKLIKSSCWWLDDKGRADALFDIYIRADGYRIERAWPKVRDADAKSSEWIKSMANAGILKVKKFNELGSKLKVEALKRKPPCVFVAAVFVDKQNVPDAAQYQNLLKYVDWHFYVR